MKYPRFLVSPLMLAVCGSTLGVAQAQPDPGIAPKAQNPQAGGGVPLRILPGRRVMPGQPMPFGQVFNPAQMMEQNVRLQLAQRGFNDKEVQDSIIEFVKAQEKARQPLRDRGRKLSEATRGDAVTDQQLGILINDFRAAVEDEKLRTEDALKALDAKIGYKKKPRLEALLMMLGLIGDEASFMGLAPQFNANNIIIQNNGAGGPQLFINPGMGAGEVQPFVWGVPGGAQPGVPAIPRGRAFNFRPNDPAFEGDVIIPPPMAADGFVFPPNGRNWRATPAPQPFAPPALEIQPPALGNIPFGQPPLEPQDQNEVEEEARLKQELAEALAKQLAREKQQQEKQGLNKKPEEKKDKPVPQEF